MSRNDGPWADGRRAWDRLHRDRLSTGDDAVDALSDIGMVRRLLDQAELVAVRTARGHGKSWAEIATRLGVTRQSAWERWRDLDDEPTARQTGPPVRPGDEPTGRRTGPPVRRERDVLRDVVNDLTESFVGAVSDEITEPAKRRRLRGTVRVPQVVGLSWDDARVCLIDLGLHGVSADPDASPLMLGGSGYVVTDQSPESGARVDPGTAVRLWVSPRGGGSAGDREPRNPKPSPLSERAEPVSRRA